MPSTHLNGLSKLLGYPDFITYESVEFLGDEEVQILGDAVSAAVAMSWADQTLAALTPFMKYIPLVDKNFSRTWVSVSAGPL